MFGRPVMQCDSRERALLLRSGRRWLTANAVYAAGAVAPVMPLPIVDLAQWCLARVGAAVPVLSRVVARNMQSAGVFSRTVHREYFAQVARHLANAVRLFRLLRADGAVGALARDQVSVDDSISHIHAALERGHGAIVTPPHVCNYLLTLTRLNQEVPICVYLRWSKDRRKRELKRLWCQAAGLRVILEPVSATDPASRAAACVEALRGGAVLVMTPDIAQKNDKGVAVQVLGRRVYLPTGPASIALLAEAPLVPVFGRIRGDRHVIHAEAPVIVESLPRSAGGRPVAIQRAMQVWATHFEVFLRSCPQAWFLWADSRWTRVFRGDPRYCGEVPAPGAGADK